MVLSEQEAETRLAELHRQREAIDRAITDLTLWLELGRRLTTAPPVVGEPAPRPSKPLADPAANSSTEQPFVHPPAPLEFKSTEPREAPAGTAEAGPSLADGAMARRYGRALIEAAVAVLREAGRPLHASEIHAALEDRGFTVPGQQDPVAALNTRLWKRASPGGPMRRLGDAVYALAERG